MEATLHVHVWYHGRSVGYLKATESEIREQMAKDRLLYRLVRLDKDWSADLVISGKVKS